ncbi:prenyltransferase, UbiA family protein [Besnoitia besnoiti]|uniref:Protoheme IX farnesyltransferase, mitochondrial n=1 Tax=Besnoitia besnoiti TaxID=94643 RepID=A0A2A9MKM9_BESBE|nr:prenyltransferase, UbiA family protein [Besnoitia besnoiti]PFH35982.1 prenyltransferase, UbiA family protein [Besnoitia besnoiti]
MLGSASLRPLAQSGRGQRFWTAEPLRAACEAIRKEQWSNLFALPRSASRQGVVAEPLVGEASSFVPPQLYLQSDWISGGRVWFVAVRVDATKDAEAYPLASKRKLAGCRRLGRAYYSSYRGGKSPTSLCREAQPRVSVEASSGSSYHAFASGNPLLQGTGQRMIYIQTCRGRRPRRAAPLMGPSLFVRYRPRASASTAHIWSASRALAQGTGSEALPVAGSKPHPPDSTLPWTAGEQDSGKAPTCVGKLQAPAQEGVRSGEGQNVLHAGDARDGRERRASLLASFNLMPSLRSRRLQRDCAAYWALSKGRLSVWVALSTLAGYAGGVQALPDFWTGLASGATSGVSSAGLRLLQEASAVGDPAGAGTVLAAVLSGVTAAQLSASVGALFAGVFGSSAAANALNQLYERKLDGMMKRTRHRPAASGYLSPPACVTFAALSAAAGVSLLSLHFPNLTTAALAAFNITLYAGVYTPLKTKNPYSTHVGAVVGAIPLLIGWSAAGGSLACLHPWLLFGLQYLWQFPHFYMLCWLHRADYQRGGYKMFGVTDDQHAIQTKALCRRYLSALLATPLLSSFCGVTTWMYAVSSLPANLFIANSFRRFYANPEKASGKHFFLHSLWHIMLLLGLGVYHMKPVSTPSLYDQPSKTERIAVLSESENGGVPDEHRGCRYLRMLLTAPVRSTYYLYGKMEAGAVQLCPVLRQRLAQQQDAVQRGALNVTADSAMTDRACAGPTEDKRRALRMSLRQHCAGATEESTDSDAAQGSRMEMEHTRGREAERFPTRLDSHAGCSEAGTGSRAALNYRQFTLEDGDQELRRSSLPQPRTVPTTPADGVASVGAFHVFGSGISSPHESNLMRRMRGTLSQFCPHEHIVGLQRGCPVSQATAVFFPRYESVASEERGRRPSRSGTHNSPTAAASPSD